MMIIKNWGLAGSVVMLLLLAGCKGKTSEETKSLNRNEIAEARFRYHLDKKEVGEKELVLGGWAIVRYIQADSVEARIVLSNDAGDHVYPVKFHLRPDVTAHFKDDNTNYDRSGFLLKVPLSELPKGEYGISVMYHVGKDYTVATGEKVSVKRPA